MRYAVILAGGAGKRLWPLSRLGRPKQLLPLLGGANLLQMAVERLEGLFDPTNILIVTHADYVEAIRQAQPRIPPRNVIGEPRGRDTANAIALAAELLAAKDDSATMAVFTADHVIRPVEPFRQAVELACSTAEANPQALVTFGIRPTWPHPGLGYIHGGKTVAAGVHEVLGFIEKPEHPQARRYVESGEFYWNSGMFVWKLSAIRSAIGQFLPDTARLLAGVRQAAAEGRDLAPLVAEAYAAMEKISIDFGVMEKACQVLMVELNCDWLDVGSWPSLETVTDLDEGGNAVLASNAVLLDSFRNVVVSDGDHLLAIMGMDNCVVVHTSDATLICSKSDSQRLKELVALVGQKFGQKYL